MASIITLPDHRVRCVASALGRHALFMISQREAREKGRSFEEEVISLKRYKGIGERERERDLQFHLLCAGDWV